MISFEGNYLKSINILKVDKSNTLSSMETTLVGLNPFSASDMQAVRSAVKKFGSEGYFGQSIACDMEEVSNDHLQSATKKFYALTGQLFGFENLNYKKILGLMNIYLNPIDNRLTLNYIQVDPKHISTNAGSKYKHIGTGMIEGLKSLFPDMKIVLVSKDQNTDKFYAKLGFKQDGGNMVFDA